jgi:hypothetical protein
LDGNSFGFVNVQAIDDEDNENFGGEDQWTTSPLDLSFAVESLKESKAVLQQSLRMADANGEMAEFQLSRSISLLSQQKIGALFGDPFADALKEDDVSVVAFCSKNTVRAQKKVYVASRQRGMFNACPHTFVVVSTPQEEFSAGQFPVEIDYRGGSPHGRIRHIPGALLIRADGRGRCMTTIPFAAAPPIFGAVELRFGTLSLWTFDPPEGESGENDLIRIGNHGRSRSDESDCGAYYEINSFSAARELLHENSLSFCQYTLHMTASNDILGSIVRQILGVSLDNFPMDVR